MDGFRPIDWPKIVDATEWVLKSIDGLSNPAEFGDHPDDVQFTVGYWWEILRDNLRRLGVLLNNGEVALFDGSHFEREALKDFWAPIRECDLWHAIVERDEAPDMECPYELDFLLIRMEETRALFKIAMFAALDFHPESKPGVDLLEGPRDTFSEDESTHAPKGEDGVDGRVWRHWPSWRIDIGRYAFRGEWFDLIPSVLSTLEVFLDNAQGRFIDYRMLRADSEEDDAIRARLMILRKNLRLTAIKMGIPVGDPLPNMRGRGWKLDMPA